MMTFKQDVLPIIEALHQQGYHLTIIGKIQDHSLIEGLENTTFIPAGNKNIVSHMKALSSKSDCYRHLLLNDGWIS